MDLDLIPAAVADLWDDLPVLVGPAWVELFPTVAHTVTRLAAAADDDARAVLARDLVHAFRDAPAVLAALRTAAVPATRDAGSPPAGSNWASSAAALRDRVDGAGFVCQLDVQAPARLPAGGRGVVTVLLDRDPVPGAAGGAGTRHTVEVVLTAGPDDLRVSGGGVRRLAVEPGADSDPVAFRVTAVSPGEKTVRIDIRQGGMVIGGRTFVIEVSDSQTEPAVATLPPTPVHLGGRYVPPPDLELRVMLARQDGGQVLRYVLHSPNNAAEHHHELMGEVELATSPEAYRAHLMRRIEGLPPAEVGDKLRAVGEQLWRELLPERLRSAYVRFRDTVRSLQLTSDEPWIPWELVRPYEDGPVRVDDDFWAARFHFARWLAGDVRPAAAVEVRRLVCVEAGRAPGQLPLPAAAVERGKLGALAAASGVEDASPPYADAAAVAGLLTDPTVDLWHVAAHGDIDEAHPGESALILADGSALSAEDLFGERQSAIRAARPLVVLNACRVGQQGWSLVRLGGWVDAWVRRCRAGAFTGPLWSVSDEGAEMFAERLYERLSSGDTLSASVRAARSAVRAARPGDPTWLAYALYAHPNARVTFGPGDVTNGAEPGTSR